MRKTRIQLYNGEKIKARLKSKKFVNLRICLLIYAKTIHIIGKSYMNNMNKDKMKVAQKWRIRVDNNINNMNNNRNNMNNNRNNMNHNNMNRNNDQDNRNRKRNQTILIIVIAAIFTLLASTVMSSVLQNATTQEKNYNEFLKDLEENKIQKVTFADGKINYTLKSESESYLKKTYWTVALNDEELLPKLNEAGVVYKGRLADKQSSILTFVLEWILPFVLIYLIMGLLFRKVTKGSGMMGVGKSNAKVYVEKETGVTFMDVAGQDEAKESLTEIVDFLHFPGKYASVGAKLPKGALLVGPPGTGKTLLAKAVAGEAKVPFFSLSGSDFVEMFVGVGASRVRDLFKQAQESAPCIIFIDEIDAIGKSRDSKYGGGNDEREQTLNQLLSEMDGFDTSKGLFILAATNRPEVLDKALLRPGRFDRRIIVDRPDLKGRIDILKVHTKNVSMDETVDLKGVALATVGSVGADIANMVNEAAINAVKCGRRAISQKDLLEAVEVVLEGKEKKNRILNDKEKKMVAYHEVGHALVSALDKKAEPVQKITIIPRTGGALGYVLAYPEEERSLKTKDELLTEIVMAMGGRAAEEIMFDSITGGAANDMEQATNMAWNMVTRFGMSKKFGMMSLATTQSQYLEGGAKLTCSDATAAEVDKEVGDILNECYEKAKKMLLDNKEVLIRLSDYLYEKETLTGYEFSEIFSEVTGETLNSHYDGEIEGSGIK